jgi:hypothetical protein
MGRLTKRSNDHCCKISYLMTQDLCSPGSMCILCALNTVIRCWIYGHITIRLFLQIYSEYAK